jgi:hypothetical protein
MADAGMEILQYREKDKTKDEKLKQCLYSFKCPTGKTLWRKLCCYDF